MTHTRPKSTTKQSTLYHWWQSAQTHLWFVTSVQVIMFSDGQGARNFISAIWNRLLIITLIDLFVARSMYQNSTYIWMMIKEIEFLNLKYNGEHPFNSFHILSSAKFQKLQVWPLKQESRCGRSPKWINDVFWKRGVRSTSYFLTFTSSKNVDPSWSYHSSKVST